MLCGTGIMHFAWIIAKVVDYIFGYKTDEFYLKEKSSIVSETYDQDQKDLSSVNNNSISEIEMNTAEV